MCRYTYKGIHKLTVQTIKMRKINTKNIIVAMKGEGTENLKVQYLKYSNAW